MTVIQSTPAPTFPARHNWQSLACLVQDVRPEWSVTKIFDALMDCPAKPFPVLAGIALTVASDRKFKTPRDIRLVTIGVISL